MLFIAFIFTGIISIEVMEVIESHDVDETTPDSQEFIHGQLPDLGTHQIMLGIFSNGGIIVLIVGAIMWWRERKREKISSPKGHYS